MKIRADTKKGRFNLSPSDIRRNGGVKIQRLEREARKDHSCHVDFLFSTNQGIHQLPRPLVYHLSLSPGLSASATGLDSPANEHKQGSGVLWVPSLP